MEEAEKYFNKCLDDDNLSSLAYYELAKIYLIKAVEQNPNIETQNTLGLTYFALKDYQQALNIFLNIYSKCPESVPILMQIAQCYEKLNNNDNFAYAA